MELCCAGVEGNGCRRPRSHGRIAPGVGCF
jgi:hypothetical protein